MILLFRSIFLIAIAGFCAVLITVNQSNAAACSAFERANCSDFELCEKSKGYNVFYIEAEKRKLDCSIADAQKAALAAASAFPSILYVGAGDPDLVMREGKVLSTHTYYEKGEFPIWFLLIAYKFHVWECRKEKMILREPENNCKTRLCTMFIFSQRCERAMTGEELPSFFE